MWRFGISTHLFIYLVIYLFKVYLRFIEVLLKNRCRQKGNTWNHHSHPLRAEYILKTCCWIEWVSFDSFIHDCRRCFSVWKRPICDISFLSLPSPSPRLSAVELQHVLTFKRRNMLFELMRLRWNTRNRHTHNFFSPPLHFSLKRPIFVPGAGYI